MICEDFVPIKQKQVARHRGHGKKSLTAVISKCVFSRFEKTQTTIKLIVYCFASIESTNNGLFLHLRTF